MAPVAIGVGARGASVVVARAASGELLGEALAELAGGVGGATAGAGIALTAARSAR
jgi:hypothetical protein